MTNERRELVKALAVASYPRAIKYSERLDDWIEGATQYADALLAALDKESPPAQVQEQISPCCEACHCTTKEQIKRCRGTARAQERTCVWAEDLYITNAHKTGCNKMTLYRSTYCQFCGGRIVEAT